MNPAAASRSSDTEKSLQVPVNNPWRDENWHPGLAKHSSMQAMGEMEPGICSIIKAVGISLFAGVVQSLRAVVTVKLKVKLSLSWHWVPPIHS